MTTNRSTNYLIAMIAAVFLVFAMAMPVMADGYGTFEGTITPDGQFMTSHGGQYWLSGHKAGAIEGQVGQKVEIKGLLRENKSKSTGNVYLGPTLEVYQYKFITGMSSDMNRE